jgi:two-component system invasion response regulator UvrY
MVKTAGLDSNIPSSTLEYSHGARMRRGKLEQKRVQTDGGRKTMLRIVVADDVDLVLTGIQAILENWSGGELVGVYQSVPDLLDGLQMVAADVILLDDHIDPDCAALTMIQQVRAAAPNARLVLLGSVADGMVVQEFFAQGIHAYLYKSDPLSDTLIAAIRAVSEGKRYLSPTAGAEHLLATQTGRQRWQLNDESLTVLRLLAEGRHAGQIAQQMHIPLKRVYWVRHKLRRRFGAENNEAMISRAASEGFLP